MQAVLGVVLDRVALDAAIVEITDPGVDRVGLHRPLQQLVRPVGQAGRVRAAVHVPHAVAILGRDRRGDGLSVLFGDVKPRGVAQAGQKIDEILIRTRLKMILCGRDLHHPVELGQVIQRADAHGHAAPLGQTDVIARGAAIFRQQRVLGQPLQIGHIAHARLEQRIVRGHVLREAKAPDLIGERGVLLLDARIEAEHIVAALLGKLPARVDQLLKRGKIIRCDDRAARRIEQAGLEIMHLVLEQRHRAADRAVLGAADHAVPAPILLHAPPERGLHKVRIFVLTDEFVHLLRVVNVDIFNHDVPKLFSLDSVIVYRKQRGVSRESLGKHRIRHRLGGASPADSRSALVLRAKVERNDDGKRRQKLTGVDFFPQRQHAEDRRERERHNGLHAEQTFAAFPHKDPPAHPMSAPPDPCRRPKKLPRARRRSGEPEAQNQSSSSSSNSNSSGSPHFGHLYGSLSSSSSVSCISLPHFGQVTSYMTSSS